MENIKALEDELLVELERKQEEFFYEVREKRIFFEKEIRKQQREWIKKIRYYLRDAKILNILTAPVIYSCLIPALMLDAMITIYQRVCFPIYGIPLVVRDKYVLMDRQYLSYLNAIEKINCVYCGYFNGVIAYTREIAARTEQYWCPIKHARKMKTLHSRYRNFFEYGDAKTYRQNLDKVRGDFSDLK